MRIDIINPNTTGTMTRRIGIAASRVASPSTTIVARNPARGPAAIQGPQDGQAALPGLFAEADAAYAQGADAIVIACFDDTGLDTLRARLPIPVVGIGEAGYIAAGLLAARWSVVTTLPISVPVLEANIAAQGHGARCARVRASGVAVLDLEDAKGSERVAEEARRALAEDDIGAIVLGCAGMTDFAPILTRRLGRPAIDGVTAAVRLAELAVALTRPDAAD